nr:glycosyltransferase family 39 protein [Maliibacterium massiliense]
MLCAASDSRKARISVWLHLVLLALSCAALLPGLGIGTLWLDECYTVGMMRQSWAGMLAAGIADVHPLLYYIMLKGFTSVLGDSILVMRLFSAIPLMILCTLGYTHVRPRFGAKAGMAFTFLAGFLSIMSRYSVHIRMYSWATLFVFLAAFYAYVSYTQPKGKHCALFCLFSVLAAYTHYFALFSVMAINFLLLIAVVRKKTGLKSWFICAAVQIALYAPGLLLFVRQSLQVAGNYWITIDYPNILLETMCFPFGENNPGSIALFFPWAVCTYMLLRVHQYRRAKTPGILPAAAALAAGALVVSGALMISEVRPIYVARYMMPFIALPLFTFAFLLAHEHRRAVVALMAAGVLLLYGTYQAKLLFEGYSSWNEAPIAYIQQVGGPDDISVTGELRTGGIAAILHPQPGRQYYYSQGQADEQIRQAEVMQLAPIDNLDALSDVKGQIIVIDSNHSNLKDVMAARGDMTLCAPPKEMVHPYSWEVFVVSVWRKAGYNG